MRKLRLTILATLLRSLYLPANADGPMWCRQEPTQLPGAMLFTLREAHFANPTTQESFGGTFEITQLILPGLNNISIQAGGQIFTLGVVLSNNGVLTVDLTLPLEWKLTNCYYRCEWPIWNDHHVEIDRGW